MWSNSTNSQTSCAPTHLWLATWVDRGETVRAEKDLEKLREANSDRCSYRPVPRNRTDTDGRFSGVQREQNSTCYNSFVAWLLLTVVQNQEQLTHQCHYTHIKSGAGKTACFNQFISYFRNALWKTRNLVQAHKPFNRGLCQNGVKRDATVL